MSLIYLDSFDHYATAQLTRKWTTVGTPQNVTILAGGGRNGTQGMRLGSSALVGKNFGQQTGIVCGTAFKIAQFFDGAFVGIFALQALGVNQFRIGFFSDGTVGTQMRNGAPDFSAGAFNADLWYYVEMKMIFTDTPPYTATCRARVNGAEVFSGAIDIPAGGSLFANSIVMGTGSATTLTFDDVYVANTSGSLANDYLGDIMIRPIYPSGPGDSTDWTPLSASNWQNVKEALVDDDATYNYAAVAGKLDLFQMDDLPTVPSQVFGLQWNGETRKTDASTYQLKPALKSSAVQLGSVFSPNVGYQCNSQAYDTNPDTGVAFTPTEINNLQAGIKLDVII